MGDVLAGIHSTWELDTDSVLIRFERGIRTPKLFHALGERRIPYEALSAVEVTPGRKRGTVVLRATPRTGSDPLLEAADGQLRESSNPYRLVLPADREALADFYATELRSALGPHATRPAERHLIAAPPPPLRFKAYDGKASFDGKAVTFRWFWTGASTAKWKAGDQTFTIGELEGVEWRSPEPGPPNGRTDAYDSGNRAGHGHLRLLRRTDGVTERGPGAAGTGPRTGSRQRSPEEPDQDPAAVVFGLGYGLVHESLPLAAAVLQAVRQAEPAPVPALCGTPQRPLGRHQRSDTADIADRIRHLGALHEAGLLTDEEFTTKKAELLAEL